MTTTGRAGPDPYLLLSYAWFPELTGELREAVRAFARAARSYDAEAGFTMLNVLGEPPGPVDGPARWLVAHVIPDGEQPEAPGGIVAVVSIGEVDELGVGTAVLVVDPGHRSLGVATLLIEKLFAEATGPDWFGTGLTGIRAIADASHPAAGRIAARFGFELVAETWQMLRAIRGPVVAAAAAGGPVVEVLESRSPAVLVGGVPVPAAGAGDGSGRTLLEQTYRLPGEGTTVTVRHGSETDGRPHQLAHLSFGHAAALLADDDLDALISAAVTGAGRAGAAAVLAEIDPAQQAVVRACRRWFFQHDQSNVVYAVPLAR